MVTLSDLAPYFSGIGQGLLTQRQPLVGVGLGVLQGGAIRRQQEEKERLEAQRQLLADTFLPADQISSSTSPMALAARQMIIAGDPRGVDLMAKAREEEKAAQAHRDRMTALFGRAPQVADESPYVERTPKRDQELDQFLGNYSMGKGVSPEQRAGQADVLQQLAPTIKQAPLPPTLMPMPQGTPPTPPAAMPIPQGAPPALPRDPPGAAAPSPAPQGPPPPPTPPPAPQAATPPPTPQEMQLMSSPDLENQNLGLQMYQQRMQAERVEQGAIARERRAASRALARERRAEGRAVMKELRKEDRLAKLAETQPHAQPRSALERMANAAYKRDVRSGKIENTQENRDLYATAKLPTTEDRKTVSATASLLVPLTKMAKMLERDPDFDPSATGARFLYYMPYGRSANLARWKRLSQDVTTQLVQKFAGTTFTDKARANLGRLLDVGLLDDSASVPFNMQQIVLSMVSGLDLAIGNVAVTPDQRKAAEMRDQFLALNDRLEKQRLQRGGITTTEEERRQQVLSDIR